MNQYTYDFEVQTMMTMFINAMSDIVIKRFNVHKQPENQIKVRIVYAPKQRVLNDLLNRDQNLILPVMACFIGGIARDNNRAFNKIAGSYTELPDGSFATEKQPLPIDLTINVSIMTRYQADIDQILSHLLPYINPYFVVSWRTPARPNFEIRSNVYWNGNANIQYPIELNATQVARVVADLSFVFKGWIFQAPTGETIDSIYTIQSTYAISDQINYLTSYDQYKADMTSTPQNYDELLYKGAPPTPKIIEPYWTSTDKTTQFNVYGRGFRELKNVYLSGVPFQQLSTLQNPFSANSSLSSVYKSFVAYKLPDNLWTTDNDQFVSFVMPSANNPGFADIIFENTGGWSTLTENVRINTFNPFLSTNMLSSIPFTPYQLPYLSGVEIFPFNG